MGLLQKANTVSYKHGGQLASDIDIAAFNGRRSHIGTSGLKETHDAAEVQSLDESLRATEQAQFNVDHKGTRRELGIVVQITFYHWVSIKICSIPSSLSTTCMLTCDRTDFAMFDTVVDMLIIDIWRSNRTCWVCCPDDQDNSKPQIDMAVHPQDEAVRFVPAEVMCRVALFWKLPQ